MRQRGDRGAAETGSLDPAWSKPVISVRLSEARKAKLARVARSLPASASPADAIDAAIEISLGAGLIHGEDSAALEDSLDLPNAEASRRPALDAVCSQSFGKWLRGQARATARIETGSVIVHAKWVSIRRVPSGMMAAEFETTVVAWDGKPARDAAVFDPNMLGPIEFRPEPGSAPALLSTSRIFIIAALEAGSLGRIALFACGDDGSLSLIGQSPG